MEIASIYSNLRDFAIAASGYAANKVIFANQLSNARPSKSFITIQINQFRNISLPISKNSDDEGVVTITVPMECTASFAAYSDVVHEAEDVLETVHINFDSGLANDVFSGELALRRARLNTLAIPRVMNEQIESRAILEVDIGFNKSVTYTAGLIETVIIDTVVNDYEQQLIITKDS